MEPPFVRPFSPYGLGPGPFELIILASSSDGRGVSQAIRYLEWTKDTITNSKRVLL